MLCDYTEEQRDTFWSHADEDSILRWFEDWNVFVEDKTPTPSNQAPWCYIFRIDLSRKASPPFDSCRFESGTVAFTH